MLVRTWPLWQRRHSPRRAQVPRGGRGSTLMTRVSRSCVASPDWHPGQGWSQGEGWLLLFSWTQCLLSQSFSITKRDSFPNTSPLAAGNLYPRVHSWEYSLLNSQKHGRGCPLEVSKAHFGLALSFCIPLLRPKA